MPHDGTPASPQTLSSQPGFVRRDPPGVWQQPLVLIVAVGALGILLDRFSGGSALLWWALAVGVWGLWLVANRRWPEQLAAALILLAVLFVFAGWHHGQWSLFAADELGLRAAEEAQPACVLAVALTEPRRRAAPPFDPLRTIPVGDQSVLELRILAVRDGAQWQAATGSCELIVDGHLLHVQAGDRLQVFAQLAQPAVQANPGEFDRAAHQRADRRLSILRAGYPDCVQILARRTGWSLYSLASRWRQAGTAVLERNLSPEQSQLASALLLGARDQLGDEPLAAYFTTGLLHVLVVSGLHVAILASCLVLPIQWGLIPRRLALPLVMIVVSLYAYLTGGQPPAVRAAVLICAACTARLLGSKAFNANTMALAALIVLAGSSPELFRTGPQLSFLAVAVLILLAPWRPPALPRDPLDRLLAETRPLPHRLLRRTGRWGYEVLLANVAVWLLVTPLAMYRFHLVSPVALLLGPLLWLPVLVAMVSGFMLLAVGAILPPLGVPLGWICGTALDLMQAGVDWGQNLPGSYAWVPGPDLWWIVGLYVGLAAYASLPRWRPPRRWALALLALWCLLGVAPNLLPAREKELRLTYVSVGHGLSVLVELPSGQTLLYDAGRIGSPHLPARSIASCLWSRGLTHLDAVVISHADADHYNAIPELLERFSVGVVYVSPLMFERDTAALRTLKEKILAAGVPIREIWAGDRLDVAGDDSEATDSVASRAALGKATIQEPRIDILHPPRQGVLGSDNANSIVLELNYAGRRILLTGDLESPGINLVMEEPSRPTDLVLAPHHGSRRSDPPGFAAWSQPEYLIISGGDFVPAEQVHGVYSQAGAIVLNTAETGAVLATIQADGKLHVSTWRGGEVPER